MSNQTWTYIAIGSAAGVSLVAWVALVLVPAWASFSRAWERIVATVLSLYVLAAFALVGVLLGGAARSSADERALMADVPGVATHELRVGDAVVGRLRLRGRSGEPSPALLRIVTTLIASEVERLRAPERASEAAQEAFLRAVLHRQVTDRGDIVARAGELGVDVQDGSAVIVVRAHHYAPAEEDWRVRVLAAAERAARAVVPGSIAAIDH